jgi:hypothetical protein
MQQSVAHLGELDAPGSAYAKTLVWAMIGNQPPTARSLWAWRVRRRLTAPVPPPTAALGEPVLTFSDS